MQRLHSSYSPVILPIIRRVRGMLMPHYGRVRYKNKNAGGAFEAVTELDVAVEEFLKRELRRRYPDIAFVGEEGGGDRRAGRFWLVDPIDGTSHFIRGLPFCTSQLVLISHGEVVFSVVYDFVNDIAYHAEKGRGAFANHGAISVSERRLGSSRLSVAFNLQKEEVYRSYLQLREHCHTFHVGASGYEFALVASGKLDGAVYQGEVGSKDYDVAPGALLVAEAGGIVANIGKRSYDYRNLNFIAANPRVFAELTEGPDALFPMHKKFDKM